MGVMVMLPFGGGLICRSKAFPPEEDPGETAPTVCGGDVLRSILRHPAVSCVLPGTASVDEAEENALAGHAALAPSPEGRRALGERIAGLQTTLCSHCGICETTCSQKLAISWMFRAGHMSLYPCSPYETWEEVEYFRLHPKLESTCGTCADVTCACPVGIDVPRSLIALHGRMIDHMERGLVAPPAHAPPEIVGGRWFAARVVRRELPGEMSGQTYLCRLFVENCGLRRWHPPGAPHGSVVRLEVLVDSAKVLSVDLREKVIRGRRCHFVFELAAPSGLASFNLRLQLVRNHPLLRDRRPLVLFCSDIPVREE
jgi:ferredoxin